MNKKKTLLLLTTIATSLAVGTIAIGASSYAVLTDGYIWNSAVVNKYGVRPAIIADFKSNN